MKTLLKIGAVLCLSISSFLMNYPMAISPFQAMNSGPVADKAPMIAQIEAPDFFFAAKFRDILLARFYKPVLLCGTGVTQLPNASANGKIHSYFFLYDIHSNPPLIQYKLHLSESAEAG